MPSGDDVLKVLVDDALARGVHADAENVLREWRKDNTTDEERDDALTDDEFREKHGHARGETPPAKVAHEPAARSGSARNR